MAKVGCPSTFTKELGDEICAAVATSSDGLTKLCDRNPHWPTAKCIYEWRLKYKEFGDNYARAKAKQIDVLVEEILIIADDGSKDYYINSKGEEKFDSEHVQRSRVRIDTRKWLAAKLAPKVYGDKVLHEANVNIKQEDALKELE